MTKREYLIELLNASLVKPYTQSLGYSNEKFINEAIYMILDHELEATFDEQIADQNSTIVKKAKEEHASQLIHDDVRSTIPLITSVEGKGATETLEFDDSQVYKTLPIKEKKVTTPRKKK